jgi:AcrR family transcriptional regulator
MSMKYTLRKRAEQEAVTRRQIVEAAVELHHEIGPARTSIVAVARRAGVSRPTVYRHFPDERSLLRACSGRVRELHPPPDPGRWARIPDPQRRLTAALSDLFRYYAANQAIIAHVLRDAETDAAVFDAAEPRRLYFAETREVLMRGREARTRALVAAAVGHAIDFRTWQSLVIRERLSQRAASALLVELVAAASPRGS